ncbi:hypothetical protein R3P38DRAFT_2780101 [Favolaschia claudopus]|uniref:Uncharacterized protein n=1 Tax=Favolaschia claudopus TaxID=2862362 RepID=A0AAW0BB65_9AGAR
MYEQDSSVSRRLREDDVAKDVCLVKTTQSIRRRITVRAKDGMVTIERLMHPERSGTTRPTETKASAGAHDKEGIPNDTALQHRQYESLAQKLHECGYRIQNDLRRYGPQRGRQQQDYIGRNISRPIRIRKAIEKVAFTEDVGRDHPRVAHRNHSTPTRVLWAYAVVGRRSEESIPGYPPPQTRQDRQVGRQVRKCLLLTKQMGEENRIRAPAGARKGCEKRDGSGKRRASDRWDAEDGTGSHACWRPVVRRSSASERTNSMNTATQHLTVSTGPHRWVSSSTQHRTVAAQIAQAGQSFWHCGTGNTPQPNDGDEACDNKCNTGSRHRAL